MPTLSRWATLGGSPGGAIRLGFSHCPGLVRALTTHIPATHRRFALEGSNAWVITPTYASVAFRLLVKYFPEGELQLSGKPRTGPTVPATACHIEHLAALHLLPTAPPESIDAAYRVLTTRHLAEAGGDAATIRPLTEAHRALRHGARP
jgi:hypothetical protein